MQSQARASGDAAEGRGPPPPVSTHAEGKGVPLSPKPSTPYGLGRSAPFSVHSRGVQLCESDRFYDWQFAAMAAFRSLRDISGSLFGFLLIQGWLSVYVTVITICSVTFFDNVGGGRKGPIDWTLPAFAVFLPLLFCLGSAYWRRERALHELASVKSLLIAIASSHRGAVATIKLPDGHLFSLQRSVHSLVDAMRNYFLPPRFYTRDYPFTGVKSKMMRIAQDRARQVRRLQGCFSQLTQATEVLRLGGVADARLLQLAQWQLELHTAFERMACIKEYRTPQGLRALARCYVTLALPIFYGPYWASLGTSLSFAFALVIAVVLNLAVVGVLNTAIALEDPFDNCGLDGVYVDEALYEAEQAIQMEEEPEAPNGETVVPMPPGAALRGSFPASGPPLPAAHSLGNVSERSAESEQAVARSHETAAAGPSPATGGPPAPIHTLPHPVQGGQSPPYAAADLDGPQGAPNASRYSGYAPSQENSLDEAPQPLGVAQSGGQGPSASQGAREEPPKGPQLTGYRD